MLLWEYAGEAAVAILQPAVTADGDVLIATGDAMGGTGIRRIGVTRDAGTWIVQARWMSSGLKPYFNDFVIHDGHAFGFDGSSTRLPASRRSREKTWNRPTLVGDTLLVRNGQEMAAFRLPMLQSDAKP